MNDAVQLHPIATAPRDGSYVLVAGGSGYTTTPLRFAACRWEDGGAYGLKSAGWRTHSDDWFTEGGADATHWAPLPVVLAAPADALGGLKWT